MTHSIGLVTYDSYLLAWVLDLPGCVTGGRDMEQVAEMLPLVIAEHLGWLRRSGGSPDESTEWAVMERIDGRETASPGGEFCFAADREPLGREELDDGIALMEYARADLLDATAGLPDSVLDWTPPRSAVRSFDPWAPEPRTIRGIVEHVLQLEAYYRGGLRDGSSVGIFEKIGDLKSERTQTISLLRALSDDELGRVYRPVRPGRSAAEEWTVRKVLRRTIAHERAHTAEIRQRRVWLLLGLPHDNW